MTGTMDPSKLPVEKHPRSAEWKKCGRCGGSGLSPSQPGFACFQCLGRGGYRTVTNPVERMRLDAAFADDREGQVRKALSVTNKHTLPSACPRCDSPIESAGSQFAVCVKGHRTEVG